MSKTNSTDVNRKRKLADYNQTATEISARAQRREDFQMPNIPSSGKSRRIQEEDDKPSKHVPAK